jgi:hypothetical protein
VYADRLRAAPPFQQDQEFHQPVVDAKFQSHLSGCLAWQWLVMRFGFPYLSTLGRQVSFCCIGRNYESRRKFFLS